MTCRYCGPFGCNGGTACVQMDRCSTAAVEIIIVATDRTGALMDRMERFSDGLRELVADLREVKATFREAAAHSVPRRFEEAELDGAYKEHVAQRELLRYRLPPPKFSFYQGDLM